MNHKRKRPANTRAGCKMCKPYKDQRFSKLIHTARDLKDGLV